MSEVYWIIIDRDVREAIPERKGGKDLEVCSCYGEFLCRYNSGRIGMTYIHGSETKLINKSSLKFPLQRWVGQVRLQIQKVCFFVKAPGRRDLVFCKQHMGFVEMLGWNYVICSNRFFYPFFFETSHMCFETSHMWGGRTMCFVEGLGHEFCRNLVVGQCSL